jgi:hypothetical protein
MTRIVSIEGEGDMRGRRKPVVPQPLVDRIEASLQSVDSARAELARVVAEGAPLRGRREAHARVRHAFDEADALLREATALARQRSYRDWSQWRHRLSSLDGARQVHLFAEQDEPGLLPIGSVRAIDTGMSGPDLGDLLHGHSRSPGSPARYGLDLEALLNAPPYDAPTVGTAQTASESEPRGQQTAATSPPKAA